MAKKLDLEIKNLVVSVEGKKVLQGINLKIPVGEVHAIMGRNGSGKTTLSNVIMGHPKYIVESGSITLGGENILNLSTDERAKRGLFLAFQYPVAIPGVTVAQFLRASMMAVRGHEIAPRDVRKLIRAAVQKLDIPESFMTRSLNEGFSGGEKKRLEMLQMLLLKPKIAVLDETDSGLDIDSLKKVSESVESLRGPDLGILVITHYQRLLNYIRPDVVHVLLNGQIVKSGGPGLAQELEDRGYEWVLGEATNQPTVH